MLTVRIGSAPPPHPATLHAMARARSVPRTEAVRKLIRFIIYTPSGLVESVDAVDIVTDRTADVAVPPSRGVRRHEHAAIGVRESDGMAQFVGRDTLNDPGGVIPGVVVVEIDVRVGEVAAAPPVVGDAVPADTGVVGVVHGERAAALLEVD